MHKLLAVRQKEIDCVLARRMLIPMPSLMCHFILVERSEELNKELLLMIFIELKFEVLS